MGDLQVIGTGFGRTGTLSLKRALDRLGFGPTYHMQEALRRPSHLRAWREYSRTGVIDWDEVLGPYRSTVDYPTCLAWRELADRYPGAKIVHTVRDAERWWESTATTIYQGRTVLPHWFRGLYGPAGDYGEVNERLLWQGLFGGRFEDRDHAIAVYRRHTAEVANGLDPERLLIFEVADGWAPLCRFLGVPEPDEPFPHVNDAAWMRRRITAVRYGTRALPVAAAGVGLVGSRLVSRRGGGR
ncbi:sulfotransferase family protein [Iamia sp. SCSIO 61187]|uniref:sulfotransferase family protein n=1 Tax=Iamia sp. SCSIO 61187 TaxID=2722752 RepID=UPI001C626740|nr:sulfotransferase family protein [Iamia sp. SCSIO 61187]QYG93710.1 sulfotransferase family protein [Iamia sp. SCSIO 61187]